MGAIPQRIYDRIKEVLQRKEPKTVTLVCPGDGTIKEAVVTPIELIPAE